MKFSSVLVAFLASFVVAEEQPACGVPIVYRLFTQPELSAPLHKDCPANADLPLSCSKEITDKDSLCCVQQPGGLVLLAQFWDYDPGFGPEDAFTLHGLWPDNCDGTYQQYCDKEQEVSNVTDIIKKLEPSLLDYMNEHWVSDDGDNESFWEHEWNKHGTCMSTLNPSCYKEGTDKHQNVADYARTAIALQKELNTFGFLGSKGIWPSDDKTYPKQDIEAALKYHHSNSKVHIACDKSGALNEVWYYFHIQGAIPSAEYTPVDDTIPKNNCPDQVKYLPKKFNSTKPATGY
ncbi:ribonuclease T2-like protein [Yarrowia lipolytica]|jgi:ribonuclease T2|uniref:ribonuclease T2 n=2 Tax=Yarrowia lipolytica TaxID=4952 RepID=Q6C0C7_YARLI|nr:YALI0F25839p [Yarrowia lipolytica CLIB122]AOW07711.1 hypothetical protein YALI1_F33273g [Yarrowia lipolytica]KAB8284515.1 ribonuclease T2-like protein [Yarrowia lipolytica]KAE8174444.1 ribonuclease T2-like protein [Yarrowia lipolytica]KAJ8055233.1 ribonuclease T2-like protein [Yarrowia lipolytica]QNP99673.1 Ribonuclease T2-like [Yarrowia lipolytica]|eukprot:XP_505885.1 YALI0F25839p [Yarrowia lipolytica CLIB122]